MGGPKRGHFSRSRSLSDINRKFGNTLIEKAIKNAISKNRVVRVLEIGCGEGRVLMELRKKFPDVELHGINKRPWSAMEGQESLKETATYYNIFKPSEIKKIKLPKIYFYDAKKLNFKDNYFDVVISQVSIQYVDRKDLLLEEVWRVLKKDGNAFLNIDGKFGNLPDFLNLETPRFVIYKNHKIFPVKDLINQVKRKGFDIRYTLTKENENNLLKTRVNIIICKNKQTKLKFNLKFDKVSSFDLNLLRDPNTDKDNIYWGFRSVFKL